MSIARTRTRTLAVSALAALTLAGGLGACTETPEETAATSSTTTTLPTTCALPFERKWGEKVA